VLVKHYPRALNPYNTTHSINVVCSDGTVVRYVITTSDLIKNAHLTWLSKRLCSLL